MHYYQFNIGDYQSHTKHLTPIEDICYRRLLDFYYLHEQPITTDIPKLTKLLLLNGHAEQVESILNEFFDLSENGWINHRADEEILKYQGFSEAGKRGAAMRWLKGGHEPPKQTPLGNKKQETKNKYTPPIPEELLLEWNRVRKVKKGSEVSEIVFNSVVREAKIAGISVERAITICCERSWLTFKAAWVKDEIPQSQSLRLSL